MCVCVCVCVCVCLCVLYIYAGVEDRMQAYYMLYIENVPASLFIVYLILCVCVCVPLCVRYYKYIERDTDNICI